MAVRVSILSCGPSLDLFEGDADSLLIGVNSAIEAHPCDIWCFMDPNVFGDSTPDEPWPWGIFTHEPLEDHYDELDPETNMLVTRLFDETKFATAKGCRWWYREDMDFRGFPEGVEDVWRRFTVGAALMLAYMLGATEIRCYGCDMEGEKDWQGCEGRRETDRNEMRWMLELEMWDLIVGWLGQRGVTVERVV